MPASNIQPEADQFSPLTEKQIKARPAIRFWLFSICALIFAMVVVGGATRLTGSGLSITEWKPIVGAIPPLSDADWQDAFSKYKTIPQYHEINKGMSLTEFKSIFWWEWAHRFLGRFIGVAFLLPFLFFLFTKRIEPSMSPKFWLMFLGGGLQGFVGWYMVASGLTERVDVSQYRLAAHLGLAILLYGYIFWVAINLGSEKTTQQRSGNKLFISAVGLTALIYLQIIAGAFVAGLKAGKSHNTWPLMDGRWIPNGLDAMNPFWRNLFENVLTVQFNHRAIAYLLVLAIVLHLAKAIITKNQTAIVGAGLILIALLCQISIGIMTLLKFVPLDLALLHQAAAVILFSISIWHVKSLSLNPR